MEKLLKILMIEDSEVDCRLVERHLKSHGLLVWCRLAASFEEFQRLLDADAWDVILSDYSVLHLHLPEFLSLIQAHMPDVPVILVTGSIGEEKAVDLLKMGFRDVILKDRLDRLVPAIERSVTEAAELRAGREAEQKERLESEMKYRRLFEAAHDVIVLLDREGNIMDINPRGAELTGYPLSDLCRMNEFQDLIVPEDQALIREVIKDAFDGRERTYEERWKTKEGKIIYFDGLTVPRRSPEGEVLSTFCTLRDITGHKQAEEELRQARAYTESLLNSVTDIYILFDRQWRYFYVNEAAARAIGRPREEILGRTLWELYPDIRDTELGRQYRRTMDERLPAVFDFHFPFTDTWWDNRFYPVPEGMAVFATDITRRIKAEEAVRLYAKELEETNNALKVLLRQRDEDRQTLEEKVHANVKQLILPYLELLKKSRRGIPEDGAYINIMESNLQEIISSFTIGLARKLGKLTPKEILVANLVKDGRQDKDIAAALTLSIDTIKAHRRNIRKKLGISGEKTNLRSYLSDIANSRQ